MGKERKNHFKSIKRFFSPLKTEDSQPRLDYSWDTNSTVGSMINAMSAVSATPSIRVSESQHRRNIEQIELARLEQEREIANNNLMAQHRVMIVTFIATLIALFSSVSAIFISLQKETPPAPVVNVTPTQQAPPDINVYVPPQPTELPAAQSTD